MCICTRNGVPYDEYREGVTFDREQAVDWANCTDVLHKEKGGYTYRKEVRDWTDFLAPEEYSEGMSAEEALDAMLPDSMAGYNTVERTGIKWGERSTEPDFDGAQNQLRILSADEVALLHDAQGCTNWANIIGYNPDDIGSDNYGGAPAYWRACSRDDDDPLACGTFAECREHVHDNYTRAQARELLGLSYELVDARNGYCYDMLVNDDAANATYIADDDNAK